MSVLVEKSRDTERNVVIHDDLRALFRASRRGGNLSAAMPAATPEWPDRGTPVARSETDTPVVGPGFPDPRTGSNPGSWLGSSTAHRLRCDGRRPVTFSGAALIDRSIETPVEGQDEQLRQEFSIYVTITGELIARVALLVPEGVPARPVHKVAAIESREALDKLIATYDPAEGWAWCVGLAEEPVNAFAAQLAALKRDFAVLVHAALGSTPARIHPNSGSET